MEEDISPATISSSAAAAAAPPPTAHKTPEDEEFKETDLNPKDYMPSDHLSTIKKLLTTFLFPSSGGSAEPSEMLTQLKKAAEGFIREAYDELPRSETVSPIDDAHSETSPKEELDQEEISDTEQQIEKLSAYIESKLKEEIPLGEKPKLGTFRKCKEAIRINEIIREMNACVNDKTPKTEEFRQHAQQLLETIDPLIYYQRLMREALEWLYKSDAKEFLDKFMELIRAINRSGYYKTGAIGADNLNPVITECAKRLFKNGFSLPEVSHFRVIHQHLFWMPLSMQLGAQGYYLGAAKATLIQAVAEFSEGQDTSGDKNPHAQRQTVDQQIIVLARQAEESDPAAISTVLNKMLAANPSVTIPVAATSLQFSQGEIAKFLKEILLAELKKYEQSSAKNRELSCEFIKTQIDAIELTRPLSFVLCLMAMRVYLSAFREQLQKATKRDKTRGQKFSRILIAQLAILLKIKDEKDFPEKKVTKKVVKTSIKARMAKKKEQVALIEEINGRLTLLLDEFSPQFNDFIESDEQAAQVFLSSLINKEYELTNKEKRHHDKIQRGFGIVDAFLRVRFTGAYVPLFHQLDKATQVSTGASAGATRKSHELPRRCADLRAHLGSHELDASCFADKRPDEIAEYVKALIDSLKEESGTRGGTSERIDACSRSFFQKVKTILMLIKHLETTGFDQKQLSILKLRLIENFFQSPDQIDYPWLCFHLHNELVPTVLGLAQIYDASDSTATPKDLREFPTQFNRFIIEFLQGKRDWTIQKALVIPELNRPEETKQTPTSCIIIDLCQLEINMDGLQQIAAAKLPVVLLVNPKEKFENEPWGREKPERAFRSIQIETMLKALGCEHVVKVTADQKPSTPGETEIEAMLSEFSTMHKGFQQAVLLTSRTQVVNAVTASQISDSHKTAKATDDDEEAETEQAKRTEQGTLQVLRCHTVTLKSFPNQRDIDRTFTETLEQRMEFTIRQQLAALMQNISSQAQANHFDNNQCIYAKHYVITVFLTQLGGECQILETYPDMKLLPTIHQTILAELSFFTALANSCDEKSKRIAIDKLQEVLKPLTQQIQKLEQAKTKQEKKQAARLAKSMMSVTRQSSESGSSSPSSSGDESQHTSNLQH